MSEHSCDQCSGSRIRFRCRALQLDHIRINRLNLSNVDEREKGTEVLFKILYAPDEVDVLLVRYVCPIVRRMERKIRIMTYIGDLIFSNESHPIIKLEISTA